MRVSDIRCEIDLNQLYIDRGGFDWEKLFNYRNFVIYKDKVERYFQVRNDEGVYYFNCKSLDGALRVIDDLYPIYHSIK